MNYGSRNLEEESEFIRRVVAPPKRNDGARRKQKRLAAVGGAVALLAAGATVTYVAMSSDGAAPHAVATETLAADTAAKFVIPDEDEEAEAQIAIAAQEAAATGSVDVSASKPKFSDYDLDGDGVLSNQDFQSQLGMKREDAIIRVAMTEGLSEAEKAAQIAAINKNSDTELKCVMNLAKNVRAAAAAGLCELRVRVGMIPC